MMDRIGSILRVVRRPGRLTGPIFDKELRVASRRRRNYVVRSLFILALTAFVGVVWLAVVEYEGSGTFVQSRMAVAGKQIIQTIVLFQFFAMQVLAVILLSNAISDETYHRTLGILMTTPINSLQIVMGKVLSRLLQLVLLLAISLPMLAILRVLGGVPWSYLASGLCITLTAAIFAGSISLAFSIHNRAAYGVILRTLFALITLYLILPLFVGVVGNYLLPKIGPRLNPGRAGSVYWLGLLLTSLNPIASIFAVTKQMLSPGGAIPFSLPLHCGIMLGLSALVLGRSVAVVRRVALRQAIGITDGKVPGGDARRPLGPQAGVHRAKASAVRRVVGPPVVWKELRAPFVQGIGRRNSWIGLAATLAALALTYWGSAASGVLDEDFPHIMYVLLFIFLGSIVSVVFSATRITTEKETQSWMLLLTTPLSDEEILFGKAISAFRRCLPIWGLLAGHVLLFTAVRYIHPVAIVHLLIVVAWLTCFLMGTGLYFSARLRRTTSAVVASFALGTALWIVGPVLVGLAGEIRGGQGDRWLGTYLWTHPMAQSALIMTGAGGVDKARSLWRSLSYEPMMAHANSATLGVGTVTWVLGIIALLYIVVGLLFFWRAQHWLRRRVF
ncbi:MAG: ABC transporter permease [Planctomycetes bacterium]|nr:ABC transporter permease [Planctomycetota bacterium]